MPPDYAALPENVLLAATFFAEASKQSPDIFEQDIDGIGSVIKNRTAKPERFGEGTHGVILNPDQFTGVGSNEFNKFLSGDLTPEEKEYANIALQKSYKYINGNWEDVTGGADHYANTKISKPRFSQVYPKTYETKGHSFYKEVPLDKNGQPIGKKPTLTQTIKKKVKMSEFEQAFANARKAGKSKFKWKGKFYTTELK